jgi:predicted Zn finger-like uncharacterized protein
VSLATQCPECNTLFKVSSGQLQLHEGKVRCGHCQQVFSGIDNLTSADTSVWQNLQLEADGTPTTTLQSLKIDNLGTAFLEIKKPRAAISMAKAWLKFNKKLRVGLFALSGLLVIQIIILARTSLVAHLSPVAQAINRSGPSTQRLFALPATTALQVEGSGMQKTVDLIRVDVTLKNIKTLPSRWPYLKIDLLDPQGLLLASKLVEPSTYLKRGQSPAHLASPIGSQTTVEVIAYLNIHALAKQLPESAATGFRLELYDTGPNSF